MIYKSDNFFIAKRKGRGSAATHFPDRVIPDELTMGNDESGLRGRFVSVSEYGEVNA